MRVLCVAEKPSIAKSISEILSGGQFNSRNSPHRYIRNYDFQYPQTRANFTVTAVLGHLTTQDFYHTHRAWHSCDPLALFDAPIETKVPDNLKDVERNLLNEARGVQMLMIWTDCDREGEHIGSEIVDVCRRVNPRIQVRRARFSAIIAQQIHRAAQHPVELDMAQADAVFARTCLDLRFGAAFTRMQSLGLQAHLPQLPEKSPISYGPCQFPTLGFVVSRYEQIKVFRPETFWYIFLSLSRRNPETGEMEETEFSWKRGRIFDFDVGVAIYGGVLTSPRARVTKVTQKQVSHFKPLPLTTVELQKSGSRLLKLAPKTILDIAEKLYQGGFLSYPRTETDQFDDQFDFNTLIDKQKRDPAWGQFATGLSENGGFLAPRKGKKNDKAHPPIHPTAHAGNLTGDQKRVYEYITRRFLASCSRDASGLQTTIDVLVQEEEFSASGLVVTSRGFLEVFPYDKWAGKPVPSFREGEHFMPSVCELREGETTSPTYLTEADLVGLMDKNGIGTDATIAQHIQTIIDREYVLKRKQGATEYLVPSTLGIGLIEGYNRIGFEKSLSKPQLRRETERSMTQVCDGEKTKEQMMQESVEQYREVFVRARAQFGLVVESVRTHVNGGGVPDDDNNDPGGGDEDDGAGGPAGRGGWRAPRGGGANGRDRGRGRGGAGGAASARRRPDSDDDMDDPPPPPSRGAGRVAVGSSAPRPTPAPQLRSARPDTGSRSSPNCRCNLPAVERTVTKESANKGKQFWTCAGAGGTKCDFFEWFEAAAAGGSGSGTASGSRPSASAAAPSRSTVPAKRTASERSRAALASDGGGGDSSEPPMCRCQAPVLATSRTVSKDGPNKGRVFWTCPKPEGERCGFFEWDDSQGQGGPSVADSQPPRQGGGSCFNCGGDGHWSKDCTLPKTSSTGPGPGTQRNFGNRMDNSGGGQSGTCFKCGEPGHWSSQCTGGSGAAVKRAPRGRKPGRGGSSRTSSARGSATSTATKKPAKRKKAFAAADGR